MKWAARDQKFIELILRKKLLLRRKLRKNNCRGAEFPHALKSHRNGVKVKELIYEGADFIAA